MRDLTISGWDFESASASFVVAILAVVLRWAARERSRLHARRPRRRGWRRRTLQDRLAAMAPPLRALAKVQRVAHMSLAR
jgi:hypothetical protein